MDVERGIDGASMAGRDVRDDARLRLGSALRALAAEVISERHRRLALERENRKLELENERLRESLRG